MYMYMYVHVYILSIIILKGQSLQVCILIVRACTCMLLVMFVQHLIKVLNVKSYVASLCMPNVLNLV